MKKNLIIISIIAFITICIIGGLFYSYNKLSSKIPATEDIFVTIPKNTSISKTIAILNTEGIFRPAWLFETTARIYSFLFNENIYAGSYQFKPGYTNLKILHGIFSGSLIYRVKVTYPEGITLKRFASITATTLDVDPVDFLQVASSEKLLKAYCIPGKNAEGYLMPSTFLFEWKPSAVQVVRRLLDAQTKIWDELFAKKAKSLGKSRHEILTLASIIEAEAPVAEERPIIAGVYYNRIEKGMLLQADPTVLYAVGERRRVLYRDLEINNPYNTYKFKGLPPGPINSPSTSSINAALNPEKHNYLFFVAIGDGSRRHNFARSPEQHQQYVAQYRRNLNH